MKKICAPSTKSAGIITPPSLSIKDPQFLNRPCFSFQYLQRGEYHLDACDDPDKVCLIDRLVKMSALTWAQIHSSGRHGWGTEKIPRSKLRAAVPEGITDEVEFLVIRFSGRKQPMVGFRTANIFHIVFLDPKFRLYDHG